jgi:endoglucanase
MKCRNYLTRSLGVLAALLVTMSPHGFVGSTTPKLHVSGRFLQDTSNKNVLLHGWMQPTETWFNGEGNRYSNPTDWNNTANVAPMLNFLRDAATVMSDTSPKYGRSHGWYATFVRVNCDAPGGWTAQGGMVNASQFNGWIQNFVVPYANHLRSRGLYLVLCATGPINTPNNGTHNTGLTEQQRLIQFWQTVANAPGVKSADNIMFELMNEPVQIETSFGANNWGSGSGPYFQAFRNFMQPVINAIRNTGADNVIWVPCLGWQGEPHGWAQYPFTGSNIGVAAHYYPAYGGVHNNTTAVQNLWNSNYKPAADRWPMMITECMWFPNPAGGYDDLFNGTTAGFGNALKTAMDNQGNVQFLVGFLADHLVNLANSTPANCTLGTGEGTQAYFGWLPTYAWAAPTGSVGAGGSTIANGTYRIIARHSGKAMDASNNGTANGTQIIQWGYGGGNNQRWTVTNRGNNQYSIVGVQSGRAIEVGGAATANGSKVQLWDYLGTAHQKFTFTATSSGYYRVTPTHATGSCLDVSGVSTADGALVHLWTYGGGNNQQWSLQAPWDICF